MTSRAKNFPFVSPSILAQTGYTVAEFLAWNVRAGSLPAAYQPFFAGLAARLEEYHGQPPPEETVTRSETLELARKDGQPIVLDLVSTLLFDADHKPAEVLGVARDVTRRRQTEAALRVSEEKERAKAHELEAVLEAVPVAVFISHDPDCQNMTGNKAAYELLRLPRDANPSKSAAQAPEFLTLKNGVEIPPPELPMQQAAREGILVLESALTLHFADQSEVALLGSAVPLFDPVGRPFGSIGAFIDITEQKQAEKAIRDLNQYLEQKVSERTAQIETANRQLEATAYSIAHTLRAPLRAMNGYSKILMEEYGPQFAAAGVGYLQNLNAASVNLCEMIDGVLLLLKVTTDALDPRSVDLVPLANAILQDLRASQPEREVEFICPRRLFSLPPSLCRNEAKPRPPPTPA